MGLLSSIRGMFGSSKEEAVMPSERECLHGTLMARWERSADMGDESKATSWVCSSCGQSFSPDEAGEVKRRAVERLRR